MRNHEKYVKDVYDHVPQGYCVGCNEVLYVVDAYKGGVGRVIEGWKLGFMMAYNAAKRGKLDFQQK